MKSRRSANDEDPPLRQWSMRGQGVGAGSGEEYRRIVQFGMVATISFSRVSIPKPAGPEPLIRKARWNIQYQRLLSPLTSLVVGFSFLKKRCDPLHRVGFHHVLRHDFGREAVGVAARASLLRVEK